MSCTPETILSPEKRTLGTKRVLDAPTTFADHGWSLQTASWFSDELPVPPSALSPPPRAAAIH